MNKFALILVVFSVVFFSSCKKNTLFTSAPKASFSTNITDGKDPIEQDAIQLTNNSENCETFAWDFGNGTTSNEKSPVVSYKMHGVYTITLTATNKEGKSSIIKNAVSVLCRFKGNNHMSTSEL